MPHDRRDAETASAVRRAERSLPRSVAMTVRWLSVVTIVLGISGCRTVLWKIEQGCETAHRNVGAFCRRTAFLTVPQYRVPGGYSESYARRLDAYDRAHPLRRLTPPIPSIANPPITVVGGTGHGPASDPTTTPFGAHADAAAPR